MNDYEECVNCGRLVRSFIGQSRMICPYCLWPQWRPGRWELELAAIRNKYSYTVFDDEFDDEDAIYAVPF